MVDHASWQLFYRDPGPDPSCEGCAEYFNGNCPCLMSDQRAREDAKYQALIFGMKTMIEAANPSWGVEYFFGQLLELEAEMHPILWGRPRDQVRPPQKKKISHALRKTVMERDAYRCQACGEWRDLSMDHKVPESLGGETTEENLHVLCKPCNSSKGTKTWEEFQEYRKAA